MYSAYIFVSLKFKTRERVTDTEDFPGLVDIVNELLLLLSLLLLLYCSLFLFSSAEAGVPGDHRNRRANDATNEPRKSLGCLSSVRRVRGFW